VYRQIGVENFAVCRRVDTPERQLWSIVDQLFSLRYINEKCKIYKNVKYRNYYIILGGDFNTDLNKHSQTSIAIKQFSDDNALSRCDNLCGAYDNERTYIMMLRVQVVM